ncbi:MAG: hypothetical protein GY809_31950 [Planctomycetes bacterium]|nr:hypothetical protein [Planctomycetota bacterium]
MDDFHTLSNCRVCGKQTSAAKGRCTHGLCPECHRDFCGDGGITYAGHELNVNEARALYQERLQKEQKG